MEFTKSINKPSFSLLLLQAVGHPGDEDGADAKLKLRLFIQGLLDECPRCGETPECAPDDREAHKEHLRYVFLFFLPLIESSDLKDLKKPDDGVTHT